MAKTPKSRNKKYRPRYTTAISPLANRSLTQKEIQNLYDCIDKARLKIRLASSDRNATDTLATFLGYGYILADNFELSNELKEQFKKGLQSLHRIRWAIDLHQPVNEEDIFVVDEVSQYAADEIATIDLMTFRKLERYFAEHSKKLFDIALEEIGGNKVVVCTRAQYEEMLRDGTLPEDAEPLKKS